jgi:cytoskeletal protein CcmA (bactofilin family)
MKENLKQAFSEVFMLEKIKSNNKLSKSDEKADKKLKDNSSEDSLTVIDVKPNAQSHQNNCKEHILHEKTSLNKKGKSTTTEQATIITEDTKISGTIITDSKLVISGVVEGDIESKNLVQATGRICGNIKCNSAEIENAKIDGDLIVSDKLVIKSNSIITGNLSAKDIDISAKVKGDITAIQDVKLYSNAHITGNITSASISIETGAVLQGNVTILEEGDAKPLVMPTE